VSTSRSPRTATWTIPGSRYVSLVSSLPFGFLPLFLSSPSLSVSLVTVRLETNTPFFLLLLLLLLLLQADPCTHYLAVEEKMEEFQPASRYQAKGYANLMQAYTAKCQNHNMRALMRAPAGDSDGLAPNGSLRPDRQGSSENRAIPLSNTKELSGTNAKSREIGFAQISSVCTGMTPSSACQTGLSPGGFVLFMPQGAAGDNGHLRARTNEVRHENNVRERGDSKEWVHTRDLTAHLGVGQCGSGSFASMLSFLATRPEMIKRNFHYPSPHACQVVEDRTDVAGRGKIAGVSGVGPWTVLLRYVSLSKMI
jgi:hypothetical protein